MIESIISTVAPHACLGCGTEGPLLCYACANRLPPAQSRCMSCGKVFPQELLCACPVATPVRVMYSVTTYCSQARQLLHALKFARGRAAAQTIAHIMHARLPVWEDPVFVTYIPTAAARVRSRGYDQAALIAHAFAHRRRLPYGPLLIRMGNQRQVGADAATRQIQMHDAFRPGWLAPAANQPILLIDDVITTGASITAAGRVLCDMGAAEIRAAAFACA